MYQYILRFAIDPGFNEGERIKGLLDFCKNAKIDEVMFFINVEALNRGHLTIGETQVWLDMIRRVKKELDELKIRFSLNPWTTMGHADRGRSLKKGQDFDLMVGHDGVRAKLQACPHSPEWRKYIIEMYGLYASLKPHVLWLEDDFRLHNHKPVLMGCFCDLHMEEYSKRAGKKLTRQEFIEGVLSEGKPHPYRKIWLDTCRETFVTLAEAIGSKVREVSPETRIGLMTSDPSVHSIEGRDWESIFSALSGKHRPHDRIFMPAYKEPTSQKFLLDVSRVSRLTRKLEPEWVEVYPELASYRGYRFAKSRDFVRGQMELSCILDPKGITFNIYDMLGNGILSEEKYDETLSSVKEYLTAIIETGIDSSYLQGINIPVAQDASYNIDTAFSSHKDILGPIAPEENMFCQLFSAYGITNRYTTEKKYNNSVTAVSGQYFRNLTKDEITDIFEDNFVILEGNALLTLHDIGLSYLAGVKEVFKFEENSGSAAYEEVCDGNIYCSVTQARLPAQVAVGDYINVDYSDGASLISVVKSYNGDITGPGMCVYNEKVLILPYCCSGGNFDFHLNSLRQAMFKKVLSSLPENMEKPSITKKEPYLALYEYRFNGRTVFLIYNASPDKVLNVAVESKAFDKEIKSIKTISRNGETTDLKGYKKDGNVINTGIGLGRMEIMALIAEQ